MGGNGAGDVFRGTVDDDATPATAIVEAIATIEGRDPTRLDSRLYDSIDPSGLNAVLATPAEAADDPGRLTVSFTHAGYEVTVSRSGRYRIAPADAD
ncbi:HalOD1 output domain-containing protein [Halostella litorea]|uniref:HalOD1 output domain-containing protein n=1 Tax=Halostella litorea TaxID=2528831 RepID=UPI001091E012|nr:HalOD1 output domain-containing protein [Halostella litorea]